MDARRRTHRLVAVPLIVCALALVSCSGDVAGAGSSDTTAPTTTLAEPSTAAEPVTTTTTEAPSATATTIDIDQWLAERVAKIEAMVADRNSGDFDAWRAHFIAERPTIFGGPVMDEADLEWQRSFMAANEIWTITGECTNASTASVICPFTLKNEFHGPAGIFFTVPQLIFAFDEDLQISRMSANHWEIAQDPAVYNAAFDAWLAEAHPDVHAGFGARVEGEDGLPNPDDMPTALEYVDEFIEQSDEYPVGSDS